MPDWSTNEERELEAVSPAAADNQALAVFDAVQGGRWYVDRLVVVLVDTHGQPAEVGSTCFVYFDTPDTLHQRTACPAGTGDFNVWEAQGSPLLVEATRTLIVQWVDVPAGYIGKATIQVRLQSQPPAPTDPTPFLGRPLGNLLKR